jgi:hypothetical protein
MKQRLSTVFFWIILGVLSGLSTWDFYLNVILLGNQPSLSSKRLLVFLVCLPFLVGMWMYGLWAIWKDAKPRWLDKSEMLLQRISPGIRLIMGLCLALIPSYLLIISSFGLYSLGFWFRLTLFIAVALAGVWINDPRILTTGWLLRFTAALGLAGTFFGMADWFSHVTSYPFPLSWSEGNRLWDYSIAFASGRYTQPTTNPIFTFISSGRQFLWALAFLVPNVSILGVRLWDALTWIIFPLGLGWAAVYRRSFGTPSWAWKIGLVLWVFLFLNQGPIYAPLVVCAILVVIAVRQRNLFLSVSLVVIAGYYANLSRWSWTYAPGLWAGMLALLEAEDPSFQRKHWKKLVRPVILGISGYLGGQVLPQVINRVQAGSTTSQSISLMIDPATNLSRQPLLWERLLPNPTYAPGILLGFAWASIPVLVLLFWLASRKIWKLNTLQAAGVIIPCLAFVGVGIIASTKIGGGSNLHNLDMFWVAMALVAAWAWKDLVPVFNRLGPARPLASLLISIVVISPVLYQFQSGSPLVLPKKEIVDQAVMSLQKEVAQAKVKGEVLFIDERQLLTFGQIRDVPLLVEYEKKYMMEMAMRAEASYFVNFYRDLAHHRFALVVSDPLVIQYQGKGNGFGDENDAYVRWVVVPVLCYYEPELTFEEVGVQLLVPRVDSSEIPANCPKP